MYKNVYFGKFGLLILLIIFLYISSKTFAQDVTETQNVEKNIETRNLSNYQEQLDLIEKDVEMLRKDLYQGSIEAYNRTNDSVNRLINLVTLLAAIFGIILTLAGVFIAYESIRTRERREEAIKTLDGAKAYVKDKIKEFDKAVAKKVEETDKKLKDFYQISLEQLSQDTEEAARKVKEKGEKGITSEAEKKVELLEKRIKFFEEVGLPDDPKLLYSKAMLCKEKEMLNESLELLKKVVNLDPKYKKAYWQIGGIQLKLENYGESIEAYDLVIGLDPKDSSAYNNKGVALSQDNQIEKALECYNKAINLSPDDPLYNRNKIGLLKDMGKYKEALKCVKKGIELKPAGIQYYYNDAGEILFKMGKEKESMEYYNKAGEIEKEIASKQEVNEGDLLNYLENCLIVRNYEEATNFRTKIENTINKKKYIHILWFLTACLFFLKRNKPHGFKQIFQFVKNFEKSPIVERTTWKFEDINPFLKLRLHENIYQTCITVEKLLLKEITLNECRSKIQKLKSKK